MGISNDVLKAELQEKALRIEVEKEIARRNLLAFCVYTEPKYELRKHCVVIANHVQKWFDGDSTRFITTFCPPQHGKSELTTRRFISWALGNYPEAKIALICYNGDLAKTFMRQIKQILHSTEFKELFPHLIFPDDLAALQKTNEYENINHLKPKDFKNGATKLELIDIRTGRVSSLLVTGVQGTLTGEGFTHMVIDDPIKTAADAYSPLQRNRLWEWFNTTALTRIPLGKLSMTLTRWHEDDCAGRFIASAYGKEVTPLVLRAICENDNFPYEWRSVGEILCPSVMDDAQVQLYRTSSPSTFYSLMQQRPYSEVGAIFKKEWFEIIERRNLPQGLDRIPMNFAVDPAYSESKKNDPSGILGFKAYQKRLYLFYYENVFLNAPELKAKFERLQNLYGNEETKFYIEQVGAAKGVISSMRQNTNLLLLPYELPKNSQGKAGDKYARAIMIQDLCEAQKVVLVGGDWNSAFMQAICAFTGKDTPQDEEIDCLTMAVQIGLRRANNEGETTQSRLRNIFNK